MEAWVGPWGLFVSAFISATLLPGGSEALLLWLAHEGQHGLWTLWGAALAGNSLGGGSSFLLGWLIAWRYPAEALTDGKRQRALGHLRRWGPMALLMAWLPVIGDPLCVVAGWLRMAPLWSLLLITLGKGVRYGLLLLPF